jgi:hypothetical protein
MNSHQSSASIKLAQSASTLGAALLGFGIGAKWGLHIDTTILIAVIVIGSIIHLGGMYVVQMKDAVQGDKGAKILWVSAWICLITLVGIMLYILFYTK